MKASLLITALVSLATTGSLPAADVCKEPHVRYLIAEIQLAGTREKIAGFGHRFHDYNCLLGVAHYDAGHRVANLDRFEFNVVEGKPGISNVVYRGTSRRATPTDIRLTSDSDSR